MGYPATVIKSKTAGAAENRTRDFVLNGAMPQCIFTANAVAMVDGHGLLDNMRPEDVCRCYCYKSVSLLAGALMRR